MQENDRTQTHLEIIRSSGVHVLGRHVALRLLAPVHVLTTLAVVVILGSRVVVQAGVRVIIHATGRLELQARRVRGTSVSALAVHEGEDSLWRLVSGFAEVFQGHLQKVDAFFKSI